MPMVGHSVVLVPRRGDHTEEDQHIRVPERPQYLRRTRGEDRNVS